MKSKRTTKLISLILAVITVMAVITANTSAATYYITNVAEGDYFLCASSNGNYAIDVINNSHVSGTNVHLYSKFSNTNEAQIFTVSHYSGHWYKIINKASGLCLNVPYANSANGQRLWVHSPDNTDASLWRFAKAPDGNYVIQNKMGRVIDLDNNIIRDGSRIHLWDLHDGASCRWRLTPVSYNTNDIINMRTSVTEGKMKITPTYAPSYGINVQYKSSATKSSNLVLDTFNSETNEQFTITSAGNNYYTISPMHCSGRYVSVNGTKVTLSSDSRSSYSQWYFVKSANGYVIINKGSNRAMAVYSYYTGATVNSTAINTGVKSQNFQLAAIEEWQWPMNGNVTITQNFNRRSATRAAQGKTPYHAGVDMSSTDTRVLAAADGVVIYRGYYGANGNHVIIEHTINGEKVRTLYAHLASFNGCPAKDQRVTKGMQIGIMGNTGNSTGPHLHFAVYKGSTNHPDGYTWNGGTYIARKDSQTFYNPSYVISNGRLPG